MLGHEQSQWYLVNSHYKGIIICASMHSTPTSLSVLDHLQPITPLLMLFLRPPFPPGPRWYFTCFDNSARIYLPWFVCIWLNYLVITICSEADVCFCCVTKHQYLLQLSILEGRNWYSVNTDLRDVLMLNEQLIFPNERKSQLTCLSQLEDVSLPGSQQVASIRRLLHSFSRTAHACSSIMWTYCIEHTQVSCKFSLTQPKVLKKRYIS